MGILLNGKHSSTLLINEESSEDISITLPSVSSSVSSTGVISGNFGRGILVDISFKDLLKLFGLKRDLVLRYYSDYINSIVKRDTYLLDGIKGRYNKMRYEVLWTGLYYCFKIQPYINIESIKTNRFFINYGRYKFVEEYGLLYRCESVLKKHFDTKEVKKIMRQLECVKSPIIE